MYQRLSHAIGALARFTALAGGAGLVAVIGMTCVSVSGRALDGLGLGPVPGDIELVEFGIGFAVFTALPYAQYVRAHARVDLFKPLFARAPGLNGALDLIGDLLMLAVSVVIAWRLWLGMLDKGAYGETSFILQIPMVWGYRAAMAAMTVAVLVAAFCVLRSARGLTLGTTQEGSLT
ncbi:TRAP transporter small permease [Celeribacter neptunius]|uniref:TRAP transporter small permease protein n=1 Tax=Celeribacter neptunius TaxID=588602 RepID=A0A1I3LUI4_9RHOB|nr:TRAP transporter small permease [Celeribacter neptunius]SFI88402.1 TRAP-type C4-dicarboxylate transport system, small permease component [Celeribacter neptunius]